MAKTHVLISSQPLYEPCEAVPVVGLLSVYTCYQGERGVGTGSPLVCRASPSSGYRREKAQPAGICPGSSQATEAHAMGLRLRCGTQEEGGPRVGE